MNQVYGTLESVVCPRYGTIEIVPVIIIIIIVISHTKTHIWCGHSYTQMRAGTISDSISTR